MFIQAAGRPGPLPPLDRKAEQSRVLGIHSLTKPFRAGQADERRPSGFFVNITDRRVVLDLFHLAEKHQDDEAHRGPVAADPGPFCTGGPSGPTEVADEPYFTFGS